MKKELIASLIWMFICYLMVAFVAMNLNLFTWHWIARLTMLFLWAWGIIYLEKNK